MRTRYAIKAVREHGTFYIYALDRYTNPAWTDQSRDAKTWASAAGARENVRRYNLTEVEIVEVVR